MKTAVSIPDPIFSDAERMADRLGVSRSRLYAQAIERFVKSHRRKGIREALNAVYKTGGAKLDPLLTMMQLGSLPREDW